MGRSKDNKYFGKENIKLEGFIHCSPVEYMWRATPTSKYNDELVILCIDTNKLEAEVRWEDGIIAGTIPMFIGLINLNAVTAVLPYLRDQDGN